jgi:hypothetical protein
MLLKILILIVLFFPIAACTWVDRQVTNVEQRIDKTKSCKQVSQRNAPDYVSTKRYRCVGEDCHDYGCRQ